MRTVVANKFAQGYFDVEIKVTPKCERFAFVLGIAI